MADSRDITGKNRKFKGTDSITLPKGTTAQRVGGESGELRFNETTNLAEYYDGTDWKPIDASPTITGFTLDGGASVTTAELDEDAAGDASIVIAGSNFDATSGTVIFEPEGGGSNVSTQTITRTNSSSFTVTVTRGDFVEANGPYAIKLTNGSGLAATLSGALTVDNEPPTFATAADTNIGTVEDGQTSFTGLTTVAATDADSDTITHTISAGSLPTGMSLQTNGTFTGTVSYSGSGTDFTFTVQAATTQHAVTRQFVIKAVESLYVLATGGTIATSGDYKIHTFTGPGTFTVSNAGDPGGSSTVDYMVVAGGAASGEFYAAGGGAGGFRESSGQASGAYSASPLGSGVSALPVSASGYPITVGGGGATNDIVPSSSPNRNGNNGSNSVFSTITSAGGGGGGGGNPSGSGQPGGSGGGSGGTAAGPIGTGNTPPVSPPQGNPGGPGGGTDNTGGGGGAGQVGQPFSSGDGGDGVQSSINGSATYRAGGGAGRSAPGTGGLGGGGNGEKHPTDNQAGQSNTGGGGGAQKSAGGSGIVILRYKFQ